MPPALVPSEGGCVWAEGAIFMCGPVPCLRGTKEVLVACRRQTTPVLTIPAAVVAGAGAASFCHLHAVVANNLHNCRCQLQLLRARNSS